MIIMRGEPSLVASGKLTFHVTTNTTTLLRHSDATLAFNTVAVPSTQNCSSFRFLSDIMAQF